MHFVLHMESVWSRTAQNRIAWVGQSVNRGSAQFQREAERCDTLLSEAARRPQCSETVTGEPCAPEKMEELRRAVCVAHRPGR